MPWFAKQKLTAAVPFPLQGFGGGIVIEYDTVGSDGYIAVIGRCAATVIPESGAAFVFTKPAGTWGEVCHLHASDPHGNDSFGFAIAANAGGAAANTIIVGASTHSSTGMVPSDNTGAVYVFLYTGGLWTFSQKLVASDAAPGAFFGRSLAFNGVELFIGADGADGSGAVYAFERPWGGGPFAQVQKLVASDATAGDGFGSSITYKNNLIIGASGCDANAGALYYFYRPVWPGPWLEAQILVASDRVPNDQLGTFYGLDDASDIIIAGAQGSNGYTGAAYIFRSLGGSPLVWVEEQKLIAPGPPLVNSSFGASVAFYGGGSNPTAFVGTFNDGTGGKANAVYRYTYNAGDGWTYSKTFTVTPPDLGSYFGCPIALSVPWSGPTIELLIGAMVSSNNGAVYSFAQEARGLVFHFERDGGGVWNEIETIAPSDGYEGDKFGRAVDVDGPLLIAGATTSTYPFSANDAPTVTDKVPVPWATNQPLVSPISFKLTDTDGNLSEFWTEIYVAGVDIYNHETAAPGWTIIRTPIANGFQYDVIGPDFNYGDIVSVEVYGVDIFGAEVDESWSFTITMTGWVPAPWPPGPWPPPPVLPVGPWPPGPFPGPGCHPLENPSFEDPGVQTGEAAYWTQGYHDTGQDVALFYYDPDTGEQLPHEGFEGFWSIGALWPYNNHAQSSFADADLTAALFEFGSAEHDHENFETSWKEPKAGLLWNHQSIWSFDLSGFSRAAFDGAIDTEEDFEHYWGISPYCQASQYTFVITNFAQCAFDTGVDTEEDFENAWGSAPYNEASVYTFVIGNFTQASFDTGTDTEEDFEHTWPTTLPV
jgi:hypothetical protein